jgi:large subunit ribosomal protein L32
MKARPEKPKMAQEPKKKHSKARKRTRRASIALKELGLMTCPNCQKPKLSHIACQYCGFYKGVRATSKMKVEVTKV